MIGIGLGLGMTRGGGGGVPAYNPASALFGAGEQGVWYDFSDLSTMFQDTAGTNPVTAVGQRIARINDKSGRGNHATRTTTAQQPILRQTGGGLYYAEFDGIDDSWVTGNIDFSATDEMTVIAGVRKLSDAAAGSIVSISTSAAANIGAFELLGPSNTAAPDYRWTTRGTTTSTIAPLNFPAPITNVMTGLADISAPQSILRANGAQVVASAGSQGTGNYGTHPLYVGRRGNSTTPFNGHMFGLIVRGKTTSGADLTNAETYMAGKTGVTL